MNSATATPTERREVQKVEIQTFKNDLSSGDRIDLGIHKLIVTYKTYRIPTKNDCFSPEFVNKKISTTMIGGREFEVESSTHRRLPYITIPQSLAGQFKEYDVLVIGIQTSEGEDFIVSRPMKLRFSPNELHELRAQKYLECEMQIELGNLDNCLIIVNNKDGKPKVCNHFKGYSASELEKID